MRPSPDPGRSRAYLRGLSAEFACVLLLRLKGYRILARRYRTPVGEIDVIAQKGRVIAAIEVKARPSLDQALEAVSPRQQKRIGRTLLYFQGAHPRLSGVDYRFDVMWVGPGRFPKHILDAWRE
jgi:putative endonuclease